MKKYSLNIYDKIMIVLVLIVITYIPIAAFQVFLQTFNWQLYQVLVTVLLGTLLTCFWIYILTTIIKISQNKYKAISINHETKQIILFDSKNQINILPFEIIDNIDIEKGGVVRGVTLCQLRIFSKNQVFIVTLSQSDELYCDLPKELNINMSKKLFLSAKVSR